MIYNQFPFIWKWICGDAIDRVIIHIDLLTGLLETLCNDPKLVLFQKYCLAGLKIEKEK